MLDFFKYEQCAKVLMLPIEEICPNPSQPRRRINREELEGLTNSIKENGLIYPITVRRTSRGFELITGQRRIAAFRALGRDKIPAIVEELEDSKAPMKSLVENIQRSQLNFVDEALAMGNILTTQNLTQIQLAKALGVSQSAIANKLRILRFHPVTLERMLQHSLTERHARAMLPLLETEKTEEVLDKVIQKQLNVAQTESLVKDTLANRPSKKPIKVLVKDVRLFVTTINKAVEIMKQSGIGATTHKAEDEQNIVYTITIPKSSASRSKRHVTT